MLEDKVCPIAYSQRSVKFTVFHFGLSEICCFYCLYIVWGDIPAPVWDPVRECLHQCTTTYETQYQTTFKQAGKRQQLGDAWWLIGRPPLFLSRGPGFESFISCNDPLCYRMTVSYNSIKSFGRPPSEAKNIQKQQHCQTFY